jgi:hypothetical protein
VNNVLNFDILSVNESKSADDILNTLFGQPPPPSNVGNLHKLFKTISRIPRPHGEKVNLNVSNILNEFLPLSNKINCKPKEEEPAIPKDNPPQTQKPKIRSKKKKKKPNIANSFLKPDSSSITKRPNISELRQFRSRVQKRILISNIRLLSMVGSNL